MFSKILIVILLFVTNIEFSQYWQNTTIKQKELQLIESRLKDLAKYSLLSKEALSVSNFSSQSEHFPKFPQYNLTSLVDSIIAYSTLGSKSMRVFAYDHDGKIISETIKNSQNDQWNNYNKMTYGYDSNGNLISSLTQIWQNEQWINNYLEINNYNSDNNITSTLTQLWQNEQWTNWFQVTCNYDSNGNLSYLIFQVWQGEQWINNFKTTYSYDDNGNSISALSQVWQNEQWINDSQTIYEYDENQNLTYSVLQFWLDNQWLNNTKTTYNYDGNGNLIYYLTQIWEDEQWSNSSQTIYEYSDNQNLVYSLLQFWQDEQWVNYSQALYDYNFSTNMVLGKGFQWNNSDSAWVDGDVVFLFRDMLGRYLYSIGYKTEVFYGQISDILENNNEVSEFTLKQNYPNPFNPQTKIKYSISKSSLVTLKVYDTLGREVAEIVNKIQQPGNYEVEFNAEQLSSGIYFYELRANDLVITKKMILLK